MNDLFLYSGDVVGVFYDLCRVLFGSKEDGSNDVGGMCVEIVDWIGYGGINEVFGYVEFNEWVYVIF